MQFESHNSLVFVAIVKRYAESGSASSRCEGFVTVVCLLTTLLRGFQNLKYHNLALMILWTSFLVYSGCAYYAS
jgi:hypothetical protein